MPVSPGQVVDYLRSSAGRPLKAKELAKGLGVDTADYPEFKGLLERLEDEGLLYRVQRQRYAVPQRINLVVGRLQTVRSGAGFVVSDEGGDDVFIPADALGTALHGDRVVARIERRRRGPRVEGSIIKVLVRSRETIVGIYHPAEGQRAEGRARFGFVVPEDNRLARDVFVAPGDEGEATDGDVVVVRITNWGREHLGPAGLVETVLGRPADPGVDVLTVIHGHGIQTDFPEDVTAEARRIRERGLTADDIRGREDLRDALVFTIDPADAKDHDDALSIESVGDDLWEVGIHIADVAHYVVAGEAIDAEALQRGTSTYLVDRVIPMLPHELSSDLCSLRPDEDRLALSLLVRIDGAGKVHGERLVKAVIRSRHRLAYEDAQRVIDGGSVAPETDTAIRQLAALGRVLRARRKQRGSLDFDLPEARVVLNTAGEPIDIQRVLRLEAHLLIEDFMLLANETIARRAVRGKLPFVYRIHEQPDEARLEQLREFAATFGHRLGARGNVSPADLQRLLEAVKGRAEEHLLSTVVLRSMKQARYSTENPGHFGLAAQHYSHFTSPIRRYPDLVVHRLATRYFVDGQTAAAEVPTWLSDVARLSSERERVAVAAERESIEMKKVEFMERHVDVEFDGTVSSVTAFGLFVLLDAFFVEGLVHVSSLDDDFYIFLEEQYALIGERTRRRLRVGDRVRVRVRNVDREERKIDFDLVEHVGSDAAAGRSDTRSGQKAGARGGARGGARKQDRKGGARKSGRNAAAAGGGEAGRADAGTKSGKSGRANAGKSGKSGRADNGRKIGRSGSKGSKGSKRSGSGATKRSGRRGPGPSANG